MLLDDGTTDELAGCGMLLEDSDAAAEVSGLAAVLLDSAAADSASITELLMGSWLSGMSTTWLELHCCVSVCSEVSCAVSAGAEESEAALSPALTLLELGWDSSEDEAGAGSELAEVLSSQAFSVNAAIMPSDAASALLAAMENCFVPVIFFFSIFIFQPSGVFREYF